MFVNQTIIMFRQGCRQLAGVGLDWLDAMILFMQ